MYEYKYVEAHMDSMFKEANYKTTIDEHAKIGWKLVQLLPIKYYDRGVPKLYEIIFEREIVDKNTGE